MLVNDMTNVGLISNICKQFIQLSIKKNLIKKRAKEDMQMAHEKMLSIASHQGNANQNHNEISPHTCQNAYHQNEHK